MEQSAQVIALAFLFLIGASHLTQPRAWVDFIVLLRSKGELGALVVGVLNLPLGVLVVGFHNVFSGPAVLLTLYGYVQLLKCLVFFCAPGLGLRMLAGVDPAHPRRFAIAGLPMVTISAVLAYVLLHRHGVI